MEKTIKKWLPILQHLNLDEKYYDTVSEYAEHHQIVEFNSNEQYLQQYLPVSLKVLSKITFDPKNIEFNIESQKEHIYNINISDEDIKNYNYAINNGNNNVISLVQDLENKVIDLLVNDLKKKNGKIIINQIVKKIFINKTEKQMCLISDYKVFDREKKLERILKL